jgi:Rhodopirellula transposase DDE domain
MDSHSLKTTLLLLLAAICGGCSGAPAMDYGKVELLSVSGKVTLDDKPLPNAVVTFEEVGMGSFSYSLTDKNGEYSLQANRKTREGNQHPDRNAQFEHINQQVLTFHRQRQPVISVDTKKKELVGDFRNVGREWQPQGTPEKVRVHDFKDKQLGKAIPYGVYDLASNEGWVSVGITHDTAQFAAASIRRWWNEMGAARFPRARKLMITADGGGSNSNRNRLWKVTLQELAAEIGLPLHVCHFPPGTSKWNKIEHRMFCFITNNWRGRPLTSLQTIVELIGNTTTATGLIVRAALDEAEYETGIKVSDEELSQVNLKRSEFHGDWNYTIRTK